MRDKRLKILRNLGNMWTANIRIYLVGRKEGP
jgi:hypothetical protein